MILLILDNLADCSRNLEGICACNHSIPQTDVDFSSANTAGTRRLLSFIQTFISHALRTSYLVSQAPHSVSYKTSFQISLAPVQLNGLERGAWTDIFFSQSNLISLTFFFSNVRLAWLYKAYLFIDVHVYHKPE